MQLAPMVCCAAHRSRLPPPRWELAGLSWRLRYLGQMLELRVPRVHVEHSLCAR